MSKRSHDDQRRLYDQWMHPHADETLARRSRLVTFAKIAAATALILGAVVGVVTLTGGGSEPRTDREWCEDQATEDRLTAMGFTHDELVRDCTQALDAGWSRPMVVTIYDDLASEG